MSYIEADELTMGTDIDIFEEERLLAESTAEENRLATACGGISPERLVRFAHFC